MSRSLIRYSVPVISSAFVALAVFACSSSDKPADTTGTGTGGSAQEGGLGGAANGGGGTSAGGGGTSAGGGGAANGGAGTGGAAVDAGDVYTCASKPPLDPAGTIAKDGACCDTTIGKVGTCVAESSITDPLLKASYGHAGCADTLKCAPTPSALADAGALGVYDTCTANLGAALGLEGRCLPKCFVAGNPQAPTLLQEDCTQAELVCAPCYNPVDGSATGACTQNAGDKPKNPAPMAFKPCGSLDGGPMGGTCVPEALLAASSNPAKNSVKQDDCATGQKCVPTFSASNPNGCFEHCTTTLGTLGAQYGAGACVPEFVVRDVNPQGLAILTKGTCMGDGELCAPCLDPLAGGVPTHSCE